MTYMSQSNPTCPELLLKSIWEQFVKSRRCIGKSESAEGRGSKGLFLCCCTEKIFISSASPWQWQSHCYPAAHSLNGSSFLVMFESSQHRDIFIFFLDCMTIAAEAQSSPYSANTLAIRGRLASERTPFLIHRQIKASRFPVNRLIIIGFHLPF